MCVVRNASNLEELTSAEHDWADCPLLAELARCNGSCRNGTTKSDIRTNLLKGTTSIAKSDYMKPYKKCLKFTLPYQTSALLKGDFLYDNPSEKRSKYTEYTFYRRGGASLQFEVKLELQLLVLSTSIWWTILRAVKKVNSLQKSTFEIASQRVAWCTPFGKDLMMMSYDKQ